MHTSYPTAVSDVQCPSTSCGQPSGRRACVSPVAILSPRPPSPKQNTTRTLPKRRSVNVNYISNSSSGSGRQQNYSTLACLTRTQSVATSVTRSTSSRAAASLPVSTESVSGTLASGRSRRILDRSRPTNACWRTSLWVSFSATCFCFNANKGRWGGGGGDSGGGRIGYL